LELQAMQFCSSESPIARIRAFATSVWVFDAVVPAGQQPKGDREDEVPHVGSSFFSQPSGRPRQKAGAGRA
jgi:hypothetical protein